MFVALGVDVSEDESDFAVTGDVGDFHNGWILPADSRFGLDLLEFDALFRQQEASLAVGTDKDPSRSLSAVVDVDYRG